MLRKKIRLGDLLVETRIISSEQLQMALKEQARTGQRLGSTLIDMQLVDETQLLKLLAQQMQIPFIELSRQRLNETLAQKLSEVQARRFRALLLEETASHYLVALTDPTDLNRVDELQALLNKPIKLAVVREAELMNAIETIYRHTEQIADLAQELGADSEGQFDLARLSETVDVSEAPVARLLQSIFEEALAIDASDIHIEPEENLLRVRKRVDGLLQERIIRETRIAPALVLRLKLMANLDISEKRKPQDGRFHIMISNRSIDVRLTTMPVQYGEMVVMRLLDQSRGQLRLEQIGMSDEMVARFRQLLKSPHGLILVTGPTGSGKSTSLYAALNELNHAEVKIVTVEDPVEYRLARVNQVQVNPRIDLGFATLLRTLLRADPDIIMVGEMRDSETAQIGLRAALTGHLVLSTLHTNDAVQSALRLADMGVEPYLVASTLRAVVAQRLVRKLCGKCSQMAALSIQEKIWLKAMNASDIGELRIAVGCDHCHQTGYRGRIGVFEMLEMNEALADALRQQEASAFIEATRHAPHYLPLAYGALAYARAGLTSLAEVQRVTAS